jgi:hypothetical protein
MEEFLRTLIGKNIDAFCGGASSVRGEIVNVENGILQLKDESDEICYVAIDKIVAVWQKHDKGRHPGFVFKS